MAMPAPPGPVVPPAPPTPQELLQQLNTYFQGTLLINQQNVRDALNAQGLISIGDFEGLTEDDIAEICSNARKPGGTIVNPDYDPVNPVAGVPPNITNPGVLVGHVIEKRLKMLRYYVHHLKKISRKFDPNAAHALLENLQDLYRFKTSEEEYDNDIDLPERLTTVENIRTVLEDLDDYLERKRGCKLTREQQQMVREVRDSQNSSTKKRATLAIKSGKSNKKRKNENGSTTSTAEDSSSSDGDESKEAGIGAVMSQRKKKGKDRV